MIIQLRIKVLHRLCAGVVFCHIAVLFARGIALVEEPLAIVRPRDIGELDEANNIRESSIVVVQGTVGGRCLVERFRRGPDVDG